MVEFDSRAKEQLKLIQELNSAIQEKTKVLDKSSPDAPGIEFAFDWMRLRLKEMECDVVEECRCRLAAGEGGCVAD